MLGFVSRMICGSTWKRAAAWASLSIGVGLAVGACRAAAPAEAPPNLLLIVLDAFRADRLGIVGYPLPTTPQLDRLAQRGVVFRHAYAPATWTKPAMASLFTSVYPAEHGVQDYPADGPGPLIALGLHESFETLAESLRDTGYATAAVANQVHLKRSLGFAQGFDRWRQVRGRKAPWVNEQGLRLIDELVGGEAPFFLWMQYLDVHFPYNNFSQQTRGLFGSTTLTSHPPHDRRAFLAWEARGVSDADAAALAARYDEEVSYLDAWLGNLFAALDRRGLFDSTVVVVTADHGEGFNEHRRFQHGYEPYEEVARVPLIVVAPPRLGFPVGFRDTPASLLDLAPTLVELGGGEPVAAHRGRSLVGILRGREEPDRAVFLQSETAQAVRQGDLKLWLEGDRSVRLYDLAADPAERNDLAAAACERRCRELLALLQRHRREMALPPHVDPTELDAEDRAALQALGYL